MDALWYNYDLSDARDNIKCIKQLEKICRCSLEYDEWQRKCKYNDATVCPVCDDNYYDNNSKCESHHHPKTLFDIVESILDDHLEKNDLDNCTGFHIVQEIMDLHLLKKVSYINLCQHCHKKYHAGHPDVKTKIDTIFLAREKVERDKEVLEEDEPDENFDIISIPLPDEVITKQDEVKTESNLHSTDKQTIKFADADGKSHDFPLTPIWEVISDDIEKFGVRNKNIIAEAPLPQAPPIKNEASGVEPNKIFIETTPDFIEIDINDL